MLPVYTYMHMTACTYPHYQYDICIIQKLCYYHGYFLTKHLVMLEDQLVCSCAYIDTYYRDAGHECILNNRYSMHHLNFFTSLVMKNYVTPCHVPQHTDICKFHRPFFLCEYIYGRGQINQYSLVLIHHNVMVGLCCKL